jgi:AcrR family transcriptional regulator
VSRSPAVEELLATGEGERKCRADAQRNVERLVNAARTAIAEVGVDVTAHEIANRAGVGIGTFYRRVSSREALLRAVLSELLGEGVVHAEQALADPDPWHGFREFAAAFVRLLAASRGVSEALGGQCRIDISATLVDLRAGIRAVVERTQAAGAMRPDVAWQDVPFMLAAAVTTSPTIGLHAEADQWRRNLGVILDGLRTPRPEPLPSQPPSDPGPIVPQ